MRLPRTGRSLRVTLTVAVISATLAVGLAASTSAATSVPATGVARLQGPFQLAGRITVAKRVLGERPGLNFLRRWTFFPTCAKGACAAIGLIRERSGGIDRLRLRRRAPGLYVGSARFYSPLRCGGRTYRLGQSAPFKITVRITAAAALSSGAIVATRVSATYTNRTRTNLTPCVAVLGHDAATYRGQALAVPGQV